VSRAKVTQMFNLLKLDDEIQKFVRGVGDTDERLRKLSERRLREIVKIEDKDEQRMSFRKSVD
jgi:hypothetical protein